MGKPEEIVERAVCEEVRRRGGKAFKWVSPGTTGVPDRICVLPGGRVIFVETKRRGLKDGLSPRQRKVFQVLKKLGCTVWRISDIDEFREKLNDEV